MRKRVGGKGPKPHSKKSDFGTPLIFRQEKAHKHKLFCPVGLGTTPGLSRAFHRVCPLGQIR